MSFTSLFDIIVNYLDDNCPFRIEFSDGYVWQYSDFDFSKHLNYLATLTLDIFWVDSDNVLHFCVVDEFDL